MRKAKNNAGNQVILSKQVHKGSDTLGALKNSLRADALGKIARSRTNDSLKPVPLFGGSERNAQPNVPFGSVKH